MGLLDDVMGMVGMHRDHPQVEQHQNILSTLSAMLSNPNSGGMSGLLQKLQAGGLASAVQSWIGTGKNQAISPDQLRGALGDDHIAQIANQAGMSPQAASSGLSALLPALVDKLSPGGQLHNDGTMDKMLAMLRQKMSSDQVA